MFLGDLEDAPLLSSYIQERALLGLTLLLYGFLPNGGGSTKIFSICWITKMFKKALGAMYLSPKAMGGSP